MNNFIALDNIDIINYNKIQSKIYKYFINHHKQYDFKFNDTANEASVNYCKNFKYNVCLCYRQKNIIDENYLELYKCSNNKRILYNTNNFNFIKPVIVNEEFNNFKLIQIKLNAYPNILILSLKLIIPRILI